MERVRKALFVAGEALQLAVLFGTIATLCWLANELSKGPVQ